MGNCSRKIRRTSIRDVTLVTLGLDNAGKSTVISVIINSDQDNVATTVGYSSNQARLRKCSVTISDLGGGSRIRGIWNNYFAESHGVIFVVDSSSMERINECKEELHRVLQDHRIKGKPIIIFANKQDSEGAADEIKICTMLDLENALGENRNCCRVEPCTALNSANNGKKDPAIRRGINWLLDSITEQYNQINERVIHDVAVQREAEAQDRLERAERVRKIREERERAEALAAAAEHSDSGQHNKDEGDSGIVSTVTSQDTAKELSDRVESVDQASTVKENQSNKMLDESEEGSFDRPTSSSQERAQESETDTDDDSFKPKQVQRKARRDSGWYPPNWNMLLNQNEPRPPTLAGITEAGSKELIGNGHFEGRKPFGVRLKPLQSRPMDGINKRWKVTSLLKKNNKTVPIMEENEETLSSENEHLPVMHRDSWVSPGDSTDSVQNTNSTISMTKSPLSWWTKPVNGAPIIPGNQQIFLLEDLKKDMSDV